MNDMNNQVNLVGMFCTRCATVSTRLVLPSINPNAMLVCPICGQQSEDWNELDFPAEIDQPEVIEKPAPQVERPSQQAVNHEPEHARRITELERRVDVIDSYAQGLKQEVWKKLEAVEELSHKQKEQVDAVEKGVNMTSNEILERIRRAEDKLTKIIILLEEARERPKDDPHP